LGSETALRGLTQKGREFSLSAFRAFIASAARICDEYRASESSRLTAWLTALGRGFQTSRAQFEKNSLALWFARPAVNSRVNSPRTGTVAVSNWPPSRSFCRGTPGHARLAVLPEQADKVAGLVPESPRTMRGDEAGCAIGWRSQLISFKARSEDRMEPTRLT